MSKVSISWLYAKALGCITTERLLSCAFLLTSTHSNGFPVPTERWIWLQSVFDAGLAFRMLTIFHRSSSIHNMGSGTFFFWFVTGAWAKF